MKKREAGKITAEQLVGIIMGRKKGKRKKGAVPYETRGGGKKGRRTGFSNNRETPERGNRSDHRLGGGEKKKRKEKRRGGKNGRACVVESLRVGGGKGREMTGLHSRGPMRL